MSEHHAQWSLSQEGLHSISWKVFCPKHINPVLLHVVKIYNLAATYGTDHQLSFHKSLSSISQDRANMLKYQSALLTRWLNLSEPNFTCHNIVLDGPSSEPMLEATPFTAQATFNYLLFIFLSVRTEEPLLKTLMKSFAHQELNHILSTQTLRSLPTSCQSTGHSWAKLGQIFQKKIETLAKFDATLRNQQIAPRTSDLEALHPYFPPKWLFKITQAYLILGKSTETVERYIRAIF
jgi:hypothetical protein